MTEQTPENGQDDTRRIPTEPSGGSSHRSPSPPPGPGGYPGQQPYAAPAPPPPYGAQQRPPYAPNERTHIGGFGFDQPAPERRPSNRPGGGVIAGIVAAALVVGGLAGVAGAAGFTAVDD